MATECSMWDGDRLGSGERHMRNAGRARLAHRHSVRAELRHRVCLAAERSRCLNLCSSRIWRPSELQRRTRLSTSNHRGGVRRSRRGGFVRVHIRELGIRCYCRNNLLSICSSLRSFGRKVLQRWWVIFRYDLQWEWLQQCTWFAHTTTYLLLHEVGGVVPRDGVRADCDGLPAIPRLGRRQGLLRAQSAHHVSNYLTKRVAKRFAKHFAKRKT